VHSISKFRPLIPNVFSKRNSALACGELPAMPLVTSRVNQLTLSAEVNFLNNIRFDVAYSLMGNWAAVTAHKTQINYHRKICETLQLKKKNRSCDKKIRCNKMTGSWRTACGCH
jgi:hypothetical protein